MNVDVRSKPNQPLEIELRQSGRFLNSPAPETVHIPNAESQTRGALILSDVRRAGRSRQIPDRAFAY
ncbi:hypothetical protein, partial [Bifidobacterium breve]|uniref:hypothetical protein n=1 Tax=Bifidobacterium breve TaxID=1685 RepID=UPI0021645F7C